MENNCFMIATGIMNHDSPSSIIMWKAQEIEDSSSVAVQAVPVSALVSVLCDVF